MSDVQFDDNNPSGRFAPSVSGTPALVRLVLKTGIVKDEKQANYILIGIAVCAVLLTLYVLKSSFGSPSRSGVISPAAFPGGAPASGPSAARP